MRRACLLMLAALITTIAGATTVVPMSVEELTRASARVVEAQVLDSWSTWNAEHTRIFTYSRVGVARALKGRSEEVVTVKQLGGSAGGYTMKVAGVRALSPGERTLLFLRPSQAGDGTWVIVGLMQGMFHVYAAGGHTMVSNGIHAAVVHEQRGGSPRREAVPPMTLEEAESRVRGASTR